MIASLRGTVLSATQNQAVIDVAGVGYLVHITPQTSLALTVGSETTLVTTLILREDSVTLFGFENQTDQGLFELLLSVSGVGPKSALAVLSSMDAESIQNAVAAEDDAPFKAVSGIGPKTAKLIVVSLAGKLSFAGVAKSVTAKSTSTAEVIDALVGLGWSERQVSAAVQTVSAELGSVASKEQLLKASLSQLGRAKSVSAE